MQVISVNVGRPRQVHWKGRTVTTGIFKEPVQGRVMVRRLNLDGDEQADLSVHGGADKAVYFYPAEHYDAWRKDLPNWQFPRAIFGENLTTTGMLEEGIRIGDQLRIGAAIVRVTQPRMPCYKLGLRFGRDDIIKRFLQSGRTGWYGSVMKEGDVGDGDTMEFLSRDPHHVTVADITRLYVQDRSNVDLLWRALQVEALPAIWRDTFQARLAKPDR